MQHSGGLNKLFGLFMRPVLSTINRSLCVWVTNMPYQILTEMAASISELKANPMKVVASGKGMPVVVLNRNEPAFYCVPADAYEALVEMVDDLELLEIVKKRRGEKSIRVSLNDL